MYVGVSVKSTDLRFKGGELASLHVPRTFCIRFLGVQKRGLSKRGLKRAQKYKKKIRIWPPSPRHVGPSIMLTATSENLPHPMEE